MEALLALRHLRVAINSNKNKWTGSGTDTIDVRHYSRSFSLPCKGGSETLLMSHLIPLAAKGEVRSELHNCRKVVSTVALKGTGLPSF